MQNANGTTFFGAPTNGGVTPQMNNGQANNGRKTYPSPLSIQSRPQNTMMDRAHASMVGLIFEPKIDVKPDSKGQMVKVFTCKIMTVKQASSFNYHFGPLDAGGNIQPIFPLDKEIIYVNVSFWDSGNRKLVTNIIEKLNLKPKDQIFVGGLLKCVPSNNPEYPGSYFLNLTGTDISVLRRSQSNEQGEGQANGYANQQQANYGNQTSAGAYGNQQATGNPYANQQATGNPYANQQQANYGNQTPAGAYGNQPQPNTYANQAQPTYNQPVAGNPYAEPQIPTGGFDPNAGGTINISDEDLPF